MKVPLKNLGLILCLGILPSLGFSTHNRAGEITYVQTSDLGIECTVTTYTKESSTSADRDSIFIRWGDGTFSVLLRNNGPNQQGESLGNDIKKNIYVGQHTYPSRGTYTIGLQDPNRVDEVRNIPNSVNVKFYISSTITLLNTQFQGYNSSAVLLQPPIDVGCVGKPFIHNPNAYDPDGDSLSFDLIVPFQGPDTTISGYIFPDSIFPGPGNVITLNRRTGEFKWLFPPIDGEFNIAIRVNEYRKGILINSMIRDMQIEILNCNNEPPLIIATSQICVVAGQKLELEINAQDLDMPADKVRLSAAGGPLTLNQSPANFMASTSFEDSPITGTLEWQTSCEHIQSQPYIIVFKAEDQQSGQPSLVDLHTLEILVVGPPPQDVSGEPESEKIRLSWESPYSCENAADDYFYGFSIWRRVGSNNFPLDTCEPGLDGKGYDLIDYRSRSTENGRYVFRDSTAEKGRTYCYRILAEFAKKSQAGNPFNFVSSLTSDEVCLQLSRDLPLILNVDVETTAETDGSIFLKWTKPLAEELDTIARPGPYTYEIFRSIKNANNYSAIPGSSITVPFFQSPIDTFWRDSFLNTEAQSYQYYIDFSYSNQAFFRQSESASSVYLDILESDRTLTLTWTAEVPWDNVTFDVLQINNAGGVDTIGQTQDTFFTVSNLVNEDAYCFKILAYGDYGIAEIESPLLNNSQVSCGTPIDTVPPCSPDLSVSNLCDSEEYISEADFYNLISWNDPIFICEGAEDIHHFIVLYRPNDTSQWIAIDTILYGMGFESVHRPTLTSSGCYSVISVDSVGNHSRVENYICVDNCPLYILPNVFTPNNNGQNDLFRPRQRRFIDHIELNVFNRWGALVFSTEDADINWDGTNSKGKDLTDGNYFYTCVVYERHYEGIIRQEELLSGYIAIIRSKE
jgi:gliding motility-associated-like protein